MIIRRKILRLQDGAFPSITKTKKLKRMFIPLTHKDKLFLSNEKKCF